MNKDEVNQLVLLLEQGLSPDQQVRENSERIMTQTALNSPTQLTDSLLFILSCRNKLMQPLMRKCRPRNQCAFGSRRLSARTTLCQRIFGPKWKNPRGRISRSPFSSLCIPRRTRKSGSKLRTLLEK